MLRKSSCKQAHHALYKSSDMACRVPWRLAAYYKMVVEPHGDPDGMLPTLNALKTFFEAQSTVSCAGVALQGPHTAACSSILCLL